MKIELDKILIDEEAFQQTKHACLQELQGRQKKYNTSKTQAILIILVKECKAFFALSICVAILTLLMSTYLSFQKFDDLLLMQTGTLVLLSLLYLLKDEHIQMQELAYPTVIGSSKMFIYKMSACMLLEITIVGLFTLYGLLHFQYPLYQLLLVGIIPIFLLHAIAIQIAGHCFSLKVVIFTLILLYILYYSGYWYMRHQLLLSSVLPYAVVILGVSILYDCICIHRLQKALFKEGRYILWN